MPVITLKKSASGISLPNGKHLLHLQPGASLEVTDKQAAILADFYAEFLDSAPVLAPVAPAPAVKDEASAPVSTAWLDKLLGMKKADLKALAAENGLQAEGLSVEKLREALAPFEPGA